MITWQPAPASTWQLCEGQRIIGSVTLGIDGLWRWRRGVSSGTEATKAAAMRAVEVDTDKEGM